jgi:UDP-N-acetylmuramoyl-tripeptide--D-alanyl-D-alanine ligase
MRELGSESDREHAAIAEPALAAGVERMILIGPEFAGLAEALRDKMDIEQVDDVDAAIATLTLHLRPGDAVLVKASNSVGLARLVEVVAGGRELVNEGPDH